MPRSALIFLVVVTIGSFGGILLLEKLIGRFASHPVPKVTVTITEGASIKEINQELVASGVLTERSLSSSLEGYFFPDTYELFVPSSPEVVEKKFLENFDRKVRPVLPPGINEEELRQLIIVSSLIEKEVPDSAERRIVAGIILKRLKYNMPLQIDSSICYAVGRPSCLPISDQDKKIDSPYNTYLYPGLPPQPISNPGLDAILAALNPQNSPYWFYLSDPKSGKTVFAKTLDEHRRNIIKYLGKIN